MRSDVAHLLTQNVDDELRAAGAGGSDHTEAALCVICCDSYMILLLAKWRLARSNPMKSLVPGEGLEPPTNGLQNRCTTAVLTRQRRWLPR